MKLVLATKNKGKVREISDFLAPHGFEVVSINDFPDIEEIEENGETFRENAIFKATRAYELTGIMSLADDSGLEVDHLDGAPGIHSARFAGEEKDDRANIVKLLDLLAGVPVERRTARFRCLMAIADTDGWVYIAEGACDGVIAGEPRGEGGFGYDPVFYLPEYGKTFAELDPEIKNKISHRAQALAGILDILSELKLMKEDDEDEE